jgi:histone-binding protein RBBP4
MMYVGFACIACPRPVRSCELLKKMMCSWDYRASPSRPCIKTKGHRHGINTLAFNPYQEYLLATGSADHTAALWDLRNMTSKLHSFESHIDEVFSVQWAPFNESVRGAFV